VEEEVPMPSILRDTGDEEDLFQDDEESAPRPARRVVIDADGGGDAESEDDLDIPDFLK